MIFFWRFISKLLQTVPATEKNPEKEMKNPNPLKSIVATGLAGAATLAAGSEAYANVVASTTLPANYTPTSSTTNPPYEPTWDVNGDGTNDFQFIFYQIAGNTGLNWLSGVYGYGGIGIAAPVAYQGTFASYVNRLANGNTIGPASVFNQTQTSTGGYFNVFASRYGSKLYGQWKTVTDGFLGFEFTEADGLHYGYVEIKTSRYVNSTNKGGIFFSNGFYETTPNTPITIGQAVPEPGTLAALAFGAAIVGGASLRRRKA